MIEGKGASEQRLHLTFTEQSPVGRCSSSSGSEAIYVLSIDDADMLHAAEHSVAWIELGDDPSRFLLAGPDRAGNLLELVVMVTEEGEFMIHAMPIRRSTAEQLLGGGET